METVTARTGISPHALVTIAQNVVVDCSGPTMMFGPLPSGRDLSGGDPRYHVTSPPVALTESVAFAPLTIAESTGCVTMDGNPQRSANTNSLTAVTPHELVTCNQKLVRSLIVTFTFFPLPTGTPSRPGVFPRNHS